MKAFVDAWKDYVGNLDVVGVFGIATILAITAMFLVGYPIYTALGGLFLRIKSLPDLGIFYTAGLLLIYGASLYVVSSAVVSSMIVVAHRKTKKKIKTAILKNLPSMATNAFVFYLLLTLISYFLILFNLSPLTFILYYLTFYIVPAMVIENENMLSALPKAWKMLKKKPFLPLLWAVVGGVMLFLSEIIIYFFFPHSTARWLMISINGFLFLPYLAMLKAHFYMQRYPLAR